MLGCDLTDAFAVVIILLKLAKNVHKFDNLSRKILIMDLKMTIESRVRTQNELLIKFYKKSEKLATHIECKEDQNCQNLPKMLFLPILTILGGPKLYKWGQMNAI